MMEQSFKPSLYLQVIHEKIELFCKQSEESMIVDELGSYENEKIDVVKWENEVERITAGTRLELKSWSIINLPRDSFWCKKMISRIRKLRAKRGPKFTFQRVSNGGSLREELYCKLRLLIKIRCGVHLTTEFFLTDELDYQKWVPNESEFLKEIKVQLEEKNSEKNSDWYRHQIAQTRIYIAQHDEAFFLQPQNRRTSVNMSTIALLSLHEELYCAVRSLISVKLADLLTLRPIYYAHYDFLIQFKKALRNRIRKVNKFLTEINQQLEKKNSEENSDWYHKKIEETKSFIDVLSQDLGSTISIFAPDPESKPLLDDVGYTKFWSLQVNDSEEEGTSILAMGQESKICLYLQVVREYMELSFKSREDSIIIDSHPTENMDHAWKWKKELDAFNDEAKLWDLKLWDISIRNSFWCKKMILRIRKLRAKAGPNFTFRMVGSSEDVGSNSSVNMSLLTSVSPREKLFCEIMSLTHIRLPLVFALEISKDDDVFNEYLHEWKDEVDAFIFGLEVKSQSNPKIDSGWYSKKVVEARMLIAKFEPAFSLPSEDVGSASSINILLHEELHCEIRLLIRLKSIDMMTTRDMPIKDHYDLKILFKKELQKWLDEVNKFLTEINLQLGEMNVEKSSDWYRNKIAGSRMLIAKRYSAFPFPTQVVVSPKKQYQIFLSFRGKDTRFSFARNLYRALKQQGFDVFMDDLGLVRGDTISQVLMGAIDNSKLSIIIFSKNFADSSWCLDEVVKILECKQKKNQLVWPVFYKVEPSDVSYQNKTYGEAMAKHERRYRDEVIRNWRSALHEVCCGFNAFSYKKNCGYECDFIQTIVSAATKIRDGS